MAILRRNQFAYLFHSLFNRYRETLADCEITPPTKQATILGYGLGKGIKEKLGICQDNSSLSHIIYFDLKKRRYRFESNGFSKVVEGDLCIQGGELQHAYQEYNRGYTEMFFSSNYLKAYLFYLDISWEELEKKADDYNNVPEELIIPYSSTKPRRNKKQRDNSISEQSEIVNDIYLAAPILTLRTKIQDNYFHFSETLMALLKKNYTKKIEAELIKHFFGFSSSDLQKVNEQFEKNIIGLKNQLELLGLKVFDSREGFSLGELPAVAQSQQRFSTDLQEIAKSRTYILISPFPRLFTSAWVESGAAINMKKPSLFICTTRKTDLPFILQERSGSLKFQIFDIWKIEKDMSDQDLMSIAKGIQDWLRP